MPAKDVEDFFIEPRRISKFDGLLSPALQTPKKTLKASYILFQRAG
jgi:hypothetical protein